MREKRGVQEEDGQTGRGRDNEMMRALRGFLRWRGEHVSMPANNCHIKGRQASPGRGHGVSGRDVIREPKETYNHRMDHGRGKHRHR